MNKNQRDTKFFMAAEFLARSAYRRAKAEAADYVKVTGFRPAFVYLNDMRDALVVIRGCKP